MRTAVAALTIAAAVGMWPVATAAASGPTATQLVLEARRWDGREVVYTGEAVAEAQERGAYAWIHVNDDAYARARAADGAELSGYNSGQAVWLPVELAEKIRHYGDYRHEGDLVTVSGTFNAACAEHGGDMDIHAASLQVIERGRVVPDPIRPLKLLAGLLLAALAAMLWVAIRRAESRELLGVFGR